MHPQIPPPLNSVSPPAGRLFSLKAIGVATWFGGPLAAGILAGLNYRQLGFPRRGTRAIILGVATTSLLFWALIEAPSAILDRIPSVLIPTLYTAIITGLLHRLQGPQLEAHFAAGGRKGSAWSVAGVSIGSLALIFASLIPYALLSPPFDFEGDPFPYGAAEHQIYHNGLEPELLHTFGSYLEEIGYFGGEEPMAVQLQATDSGYTVHLLMLHQYWEDPDFLAEMRTIRTDLETTVLGQPVTIVLRDTDLKRSYRKEL